MGAVDVIESMERWWRSKIKAGTTVWRTRDGVSGKAEGARASVRNRQAMMSALPLNEPGATLTITHTSNHYAHSKC